METERKESPKHEWIQMLEEQAEEAFRKRQDEERGTWIKERSQVSISTYTNRKDVDVVASPLLNDPRTLAKDKKPR